MLTSLLAGLNPTISDERGGVVLRREQVKLVLFDGKAATIEHDIHQNNDHAMLGSLGAITRKHLNDNFLPDWLEEGTESSLRDFEDHNHPNPNATVVTSLQQSIGSESTAILSASQVGSGNLNTSPKGPGTDLDKFYEEDNDTKEQSEEGEFLLDGHEWHSTDDSLESEEEEGEEGDSNDDETENK